MYRDIANSASSDSQCSYSMLIDSEVEAAKESMVSMAARLSITSKVYYS